MNERELLERAASKRGRPTLDRAARERDRRRTVLHKGMLACYEIIDGIRNELAELDAADAAALAGDGSER